MIYLSNMTLDLLAEQILCAAMMSCDNRGLIVRAPVSRADAPKAAKAALDALYGKGNWTSSEEWPTKGQIYGKSFPTEFSFLSNPAR